VPSPRFLCTFVYVDAGCQLCVCLCIHSSVLCCVCVSSRMRLLLLGLNIVAEISATEASGGKVLLNVHALSYERVCCVECARSIYFDIWRPHTDAHALFSLHKNNF